MRQRKTRINANRSRHPRFSSTDQISSLYQATSHQSNQDQMNASPGDEEVLTLDFSNLGNMAFTKPVDFTYFGHTGKTESWRQLYSTVCRYLFSVYNGVFRKLKNGIISGKGKTKVVGSNELSILIAPYRLAPGFYLETNRSTNDLLKSLKWFLDECSIDYKKIAIRYIKKQDVNGASKQTLKQITDHITGQTEQEHPRYYRADKEHFYRWLKNNRRLAKDTCELYVAAIRKAEKFAQSSGFRNTVLYTTESLEARITAKVLLKNSSFKNFDKKNLNCLSKAISELLDFYSFRDCMKPEDDTPEIREEPKAKVSIIRRQINSSEAPIKTSFDEYATNLAGRKPEKLTIFGEESRIDQWVDVFILLCKTAAEIEPERFRQLVGQHFSFTPLTPFFSNGNAEGIWKYRITEGIWVEKCFPENVFPKLCQIVCQKCQFSNVDIYLGENPSAALQHLESDLRFLLSEHFPYGYRYGSKITVDKLRSHADVDGLSSLTGRKDSELDEVMKNIGFCFGNKVYPVETKDLDMLSTKITEAFQCGVKAIQYDALYQQVRDLLPDYVSEEYLSQLLRRYFPKQYNFGKFIFCPEDGVCFDHYDQEQDKIATEIQSVWREEDGMVLTLEQISNKLSYITTDLIQEVLKKDPGFIKVNGSNTYAQLKLLNIPESAKSQIVGYVESMIASTGYIWIDEIPVGNLQQLNEELSEEEIRLAIFNLCLRKKFKKSGRTISSLDSPISTTQIIKQYCEKHETCNLTEVTEYFREQLGYNYPFIVDILEDQKIRKNELQFVPVEMVHFDVEQIDSLIDSLMCGRKYLPVQMFTSFVEYPVCNFRWNVYLLQSFCRHFSRRFTTLRRMGNTTFLGVIVRRESGFDQYDAVLADALANSETVLNEKIALSFLNQNGYLENKKSGGDNFSKILKKAENIRFGK